MISTTTCKTIGDITIRNLVGERSFERGLQYFRTGAIFEARRQDNMLKARCEGGRAIPYRVQAVVDDNGQVTASCTCPVGHEGQCKHVAALLLTWQARPEEFVTIEDVDEALAKRSKDELMVLVKQMLRQQPDLEILLETPLPLHSCSQIAASETYRRQAAAVFRHLGYAYGVVDDVARALSAIIAIGDDFTARGCFDRAAAVYVGVLDELRDQSAAYVDEEEVLPGIARICVDGLGQCLENSSEDLPERESWLRALWKSYVVDLTLGATILSRSVVSALLAHATPTERRRLIDWVRDEIERTGHNFRQAELNDLLLELQLDFKEDAEYYRICRETGRYARLIARLLARGRYDDAVAETRRLDDDLVLDVASTFERSGQSGEFERLLSERAETTINPGILEWLRSRAEERADLANAYAHVMRLFDLRGSFADYQHLRRTAQAIGTWPIVHDLILAKLHGRGSYATLIEIYLDEGEIDRALELVTNRELASLRTNADEFRLALEVARAAEARRPGEASKIYQHYAEYLITQRGRNNYVTACDVLRRSRALLINSGNADAWDKYVSELRQHHRSLRALQDEMVLAGL